MWYPFPAGQISLKAAVARARGQASELLPGEQAHRQPPSPKGPWLTSAISWAALAPGTPGLADAAAAELAGEACGQGAGTGVQGSPGENTGSSPPACLLQGPVMGMGIWA